MFRTLISLIRSHALRLMGMGLIFAMVITIITLIQQIITNIGTQITEQTKPIVGADLTIESGQPREEIRHEELITLIRDAGGEPLNVIEFYTTIIGPEETKLVQVKAVEPWYPRYGAPTIQPIDSTETAPSTTLDLDGGVWIDPETYALIDSTDMIQVGETDFRIQGIITEQTSAWFNFLDEGRTIILPYELVDQTGLTEFGSRSEYQIQVQTPNDTIAQNIQTIIKDTYGEEIDVDLASDRIEQLGGIVDQLNQYTSIILIVTLILSLMVMTIATMTMSLQIKSAIAIMRILGITRGQTAMMTMILLGGMFVVGAMMGISLAYRWVSYGAHLVPTLTEIVRYPAQLIIVGWLVVISFVMTCRQPILYLSTTHPLALLQSPWSQTPYRQYTPWIIATGAWLMGILLTGTIRFAGIIVAIASAILVAGYWWLMRLMQWLHRRMDSWRTKYFTRFEASRQTIIPGNQTGLLVGGLSSALVGFCVIVALSLSFLDRLDTSAINQPNLFILNVRDQDITIIQEQEPEARLYDTILGRISHINNSSLNEFFDGEPSGEFTREFNITTQPLDNSPIVQWSILTGGGVSLDESFAQRLGVRLGDRLRLLIQGRSFDLTITSLRQSIRTGAEPFFYIQIDPVQFAQAPRSWFWVTRQDPEMISEFQQNTLETVGAHLSFVDITAIIDLVTDISQQIVSIIIACMSIIITLIILISIASNEASALVAKKTYRLYHIIGMTRDELRHISWRTGYLYIASIIAIIILLVPSILRMIYHQSPILTRATSSIIPILAGVGATVLIMIISYSWFHKRIIDKI